MEAAKPDIALSVPFYPQKQYYCGPSSLAMTMEYTGIKSDPDTLAKEVFTEKAKGSYQQDMLTGARRGGRIPYIIKSPDEMTSQLTQGRPVLVFLNLGLSWHAVWHYAVVTGIKGQDREVLMHSGDTKDYTMGLATFDHVWARAQYWGFVLLKPGEVPTDADPLRFLDAVSAYEQTDADKAALSYEAAYKKWPKDRNVMFAWANSLLNRKQLSDAIDVYRYITELYPDYGDAWNNMAEALKQSGLARNAAWAAENAVKSGGRNIDIYKETLKSLQTP